MAAPNISVIEKLQELRKDYTSTLPRKMGAIEDLWRTLQDSQWNQDCLATIHRHTHSLAGSGTTFGFENISQSARALDMEFKFLMENIVIPDADTIADIKVKLESLKRACDEAGQTGKQTIDQEYFSSLHLSDTQSASPEYHIMLFEEASGSNAQLAKQLEGFDYQVSIHTLNKQIISDEMQMQIQQQNPKVFVFSVDEFNEDTQRIVSEFKQRFSSDIPFFFISNSGEMQHRLNAVRCGSDAFYLSPFDTTAFVDQLDGFCNKAQTEPYRVMIIDDSASLANAYSMFLQQAGISTQVIIDPLQTCNVLCEFKPDLILLDMYMPSCSGPELAAVIRQQITYASVPIVYLSAESDVSTQLNAMSLGGDDFLTKPIKPSHLIRAVKIRAERYRNLRGYMIRDSLTGLFNHSKTEEQLHIELSRAERNQHFLAYAMVDIDHFKSINDSYGHAAGDMVIKSLARLMQKTLRKTDIVGRYGGEEFAALLYNANPEQAFDIMENLRTDFEKIEHSYNNQTFKVSFSCGIALYPTEKKAEDLHKAADEALYQAKQQGRNRIVLAQK